MARPSHRPDEDTRRQVEAMAGYGVREDEIAEFIGIDPKTLRKHYRSEQRRGHTKANAKVAENLYRRATGESREAVTAAIFWLKTRAGWRETFAHELSGRDGAPIEMVEHDPRKLARVIFGLLQEARLEDAPARLPPPSPYTDTGYPI
jgi:DNA-binding CsgD family transcriptional regulator